MAPADAPAPLRRLTREEYAHTVRDLLGDTSGVAGAFAADGQESTGFTAGGAITGVEAIQYFEASERLAGAAVKRLDLLLPCRPEREGEEACALLFLRSFGKRAWRRPLAEDEVAALAGLYRQTRGRGASFARGVRTMLTALLQAPAFLYHTEWAPTESSHGRDRPSSYALAARLSYFLWATMPDAELLELAGPDSLQRPEVVEAQARRMLADWRATDALERFATDWLLLEDGGPIEKDGRFREWNDDLRRSVAAETPRFVARVIREGDGRLDTLLTARWTWADARVAKLYGLEAPFGAEIGEVTFPPEAGRAGVLTQAALLARNASPSATSPTRRGKVIRERILCETLPPPPPDTDTTPPRAKKDLSVREQIEDHALKIACAECHDKIDPIGLTLEGFDAIGRAQKEDGGKPVDTTGALEGTDVDGPLADARALAERLARSDQVRNCMGTQMFRFALGRGERGGEPSLREALDRFRASGGNVRELVVAIASSAAFRGEGARQSQE